MTPFPREMRRAAQSLLSFAFEKHPLRVWRAVLRDQALSDDALDAMRLDARALARPAQELALLDDACAIFEHTKPWHYGNPDAARQRMREAADRLDAMAVRVPARDDAPWSNIPPGSAHTVQGWRQCALARCELYAERRGRGDSAAQWRVWHLGFLVRQGTVAGKGGLGRAMRMAVAACAAFVETREAHGFVRAVLSR